MKSHSTGTLAALRNALATLLGYPKTMRDLLKRRLGG